MISFELNQLTGQTVSTRDVKKWLSKVDQVLKLKKDLGISIAIVGLVAMKKLNHTYRGRDKVTDVLSFGEMDGMVEKHFTPKNYLGEVVICYPQAVKQAKTAKHSVQKEIQTLLVHGTMHLLGYDHEVDSEAQVMEALEKKMLE